VNNIDIHLGDEKVADRVGAMPGATLQRGTGLSNYTNQYHSIINGPPTKIHVNQTQPSASEVNQLMNGNGVNGKNEMAGKNVVTHCAQFSLNTEEAHQFWKGSAARQSVGLKSLNKFKHALPAI